MRTFVASAATLGLTAGLFLSGPAAAADTVRYSDGPATVTLDACGTEQSSTYVEGCSYVYMRSKGAPYFTYPTAPGQVAWQGALAGDRLTFPAMNWPTLTRLFMSTATVTTGPVSGTIDGTGHVHMAFDYSILINALGDLCTLSGTADLTSEGVDWLSGAGAGRNYDPLTARFAVASTGYSPITATGTCLRVTEYAYDLSAGMAWYLTGMLTIPPGVDQPQTADVNTPKRIKAHGKTVLLPTAVVTSAGQTAVPTVTWSRKKTGRGTSRKWARVTYAASGKVTLRTTGKAKRLYVTLQLHAPAAEGYTVYDFTKTWRVRAR